MTGSLQVKGDNYYAVLNFRDLSGKRVQKWINLNMSVKETNDGQKQHSMNSW